MKENVEKLMNIIKHRKKIINQTINKNMNYEEKKIMRDRKREKWLRGVRM